MEGVGKANKVQKKKGNRVSTFAFGGTVEALELFTTFHCRFSEKRLEKNRSLGKSTGALQIIDKRPRILP